MTKISLIIVHYQNQSLTQKCLQSVNQLITNNYQLKIILVNNNSSENIDYLKKTYPNMLLLNPGKNLGFCGGYNLGIQQALKDKSDCLLLLNNDTQVDPLLLVKLIQTAERQPAVGIFSPKIYFAPGYEYHHDRYTKQQQGKVIWYAGGKIDWPNLLFSHRGIDEVDQGQYDRIEETDFVSGCAMLIKKAVIEKIGFLDDHYYLYLEDTDFCQRAKKAGYKLLYVPQAKVWHYNAGSSQVGGDLHDYYLTRNRLLFGFRYAPNRTKIALVKESLKLLLAGRFWQKIGVRDFYLRRFGKGSYSEVK